MSSQRKRDKLVILSLAFNYHDSNIALSVDDEILASLELERLFRAKKIGASIPHMEVAARYLLERCGLDVSDVSYLVVNALNNQFEEGEYTADVQERSYTFLGRSFPAFVVRHHVAHAGFYYFSPFSNALIASCDGGGDNRERVAYFLGNGVDIERLLIDTSAHTSTKPYGQFSAYLYGQPFSEGKLMGLSGLGTLRDDLQKRVSAIFGDLRDVDFVSGQALLGRFFKGERGLAMRDPNACASLAACIQFEFTKRRVADVKSIFAPAYQNIVLTGGSALNLECNSLVFQDVTKNIYVPPSCDDTGIALGQCAVLIAKILRKKPRCVLPYLGVSESHENYSRTARRMRTYYNIENNPKSVAQRLANGELCLRHSGRPEIGPRALGHRSFLMSPVNVRNREIISTEVKQREWYRPVAPVVLEKDLSEYFVGGPSQSPYMMFSYTATERTKKEAPAVVHFDGTSRVQTIQKEQDAFLYQVLVEFKKLTGVGMLINTSLNLRGHPISNFLHDTFEIARKIHIKSFISSDYDERNA